MDMRWLQSFRRTQDRRGMTFPMKFAFVGMAEVEDVDVVVTLMSDMVGDCEETIMDNIIMLGEHGITVETAYDDMAGYYQKMEQAGKKEDNGIVSLADLWQYFSSVSEPTDRRLYE